MNESNRAHILIVEDDQKVRLLLRRCFEGEGFRVTEAARGADVARVIAAGDVDLVTLDLTLPDTDGLSVARQVREHSAVPIIMVTGKGEMIDRVIGLEIGADDYIAKPFHLREVLARVRAVLRRTREAPRPQSHSTADAGVQRFDRWVLDRQRRELRGEDDQPCALTTSEFGLLEIFVDHPNRVLSRDQIMDLLKGHEWSPMDRSIDNLVARLRRKIDAADSGPSLVKTVRGLGYIFTAQVKTVRSAAS